MRIAACQWAGWAAARSDAGGFGGSFPGITLAHKTREKHEVDEVIELARRAGGAVVKEAQIAGWGGCGYFTDPDGYYWEVAWSPRGQFRDDGSLVID